MPAKRKPAKAKMKPRLSAAERHKRFVAMGEEVEASNKPLDFDKAFKIVTAVKPDKNPLGKK